MKKIKLISALALTVVMAACDDFELPNPPGQTNPDPEAYFADTDFALAPVSETLMLTEATEANHFVTVANITTLQNFPADYTLEVDMEIGNNAQFAKTTTVATTIDGNALTIDPSILNGAIRDVVTKAPGTYGIDSRFVAYAAKGNTRVRLGGVNNYYLTEVLSVKTFEADKVIENVYYVVPCDAAGTPDWAGAKAMNNTSGANMVGYDYPEFALKVESPTPDGYYFKIGAKSVVEAKDASQLLGVNISDEQGMHGKLGASYEVGHVSITGDVLITINVELDSYDVSYAFEALYPFTSGNTSKPGDVMLLYTDNYISYSGVAMLNTVWYCAAQPDYKGAVVFKQDTELGFEDSEDGLTRTGALTTSADGGRLEVPVRGKHLFYIDVNLVQLTYSLTCLQTLSVIGDGNGWDLATAAPLTPSADFKTWTAEGVVIGNEFKINANGAWAIGFSGTSVPDTTGKQVYEVHKQDGGDNLHATPGTYKVTVNFSAYPYTVTLE
ncbi:MAG: hypothetical protein K2L96_02590 [Muribaculaceae bacterium]|nr:hypothetical protein [Muribaculaceae bacterium]